MSILDVRRRLIDQPPCGPWFIACVGSIGEHLTPEGFHRAFSKVAGVPVSWSASGSRLAVAFAASDPEQVAVSSDGRRIAAVFGELHGDTATTACRLAESSCEITPALARGLNGSWALFRFDADRGEATFATDRLGSRRIFAGSTTDSRWYASSLRHHPLRGGTIDHAAIGWYLTHGAIYGNRTPYEAVRVLPPSVIHRITAAGASAERYWSPAFSSASISGGDARRLEADFADLLVDAVRCRVSGAEPLCISLSAGYDAAGIVGILGERLRVPDVRCFSYARGTLTRDSDEWISSETARRLGYEHEVLSSYGGDYASWVETNAAASQCMAGLCDEIDAWATLASRMTGQSAAVMVGDECLGWTDYALKQPVDALRAAQIQGGPHVTTAARVLEPSICNRVVEGIESDISTMLADAPFFEDLHDLKDYFYITQRAPNYILPWRQSFASRVGNVRSPLLDARVLDFMATVPAPLRRQKVLYRRTISRLCPATFALPRATSASYHIDHTAEFAAARSSLLPLRSAELAALAAPKLTDAVDEAVRSASRPSRRSSLYGLLVKSIKHTPIGDLLRKAQPAPPVRNPSPAELMARLFCLDRALVGAGYA